MKNNNKECCPYKSAVKDTIVIQVFLGIVTAAIFDGGLSSQAWAFSVAAFWPMAIMLIIRGRKEPNKIDPHIIRWAFLLILFVLMPLVSITVWKYQGKL